MPNLTPVPYNPDKDKKQSIFVRLYANFILPTALKSKTFLVFCARPFTPAVVWLYNHPRISILFLFFTPVWKLKLTFLRVDREKRVITFGFAPWVILIVGGLVFTLTKLNIMLYKNLVRDAVDPSEPHAMVAYGEEDPEFSVSDQVDPRLEDIARNVARDLAKLGLQFEFIGYSPFGSGASSKFDPQFTVGFCEVSFGYDSIARPLHKGWVLMKGSAGMVFNYNPFLDSAVISIGKFTFAFDLDEKLRRSNTKAIANRANILAERLVRKRKSAGVCDICGQDVTHIPVVAFARIVTDFLRRE